MAPPITPPIECTCAVLANSQIICGTVHAVSLVPRPLSEKSRRVWQHVLHCSVQKEFNQLLNHVLMFTRASVAIASEENHDNDLLRNPFAVCTYARHIECPLCSKASTRWRSTEILK